MNDYQISAVLEVATSLAGRKRPELASRTGVGLVETCTTKLHIFRAKFKSFRCQLELAATLPRIPQLT
jgi:hypothetical protein